MSFPDLETLSGQKIFVTGATGFIGRRMVEGLLANNVEVTALLRSRHGAAGLARLGVKVIVGSLSDQNVLTEALTGQTAVVHMAYDVRGSVESNIAAFDGLFTAARLTGVGRFIHVSSIVVYDDWPDGVIDECSPSTESDANSYRFAKLTMENRLLSDEMPSAIIQPSLVYGPGSALWTDKIAEQLLTGTVVVPQPEGNCNAVFVDDVVQAILRAIALPDLKQERFIISGAEPIKWSDLLSGYTAILGTGKVRYEPLQVLLDRLEAEPVQHSQSSRPSTAARISAFGRRVLGRNRFEALVLALRRRLAKHGGDIYPDWHLTRLYSSQGICRIDRARERLGYDPQYTLEQGIAATSAYLNARYSVNSKSGFQQG